MSAVSRIHPTAIVDAGAELHETVEVGPYSIIGPGVTIDAGTWIGPHVVLRGPMTIGRDNKIFQFASLGEISQDMSAKADDATRVEIGDGNTIREYVTIQRGTLKETAALTRIGDRNWIMNGVHIGHDSIVGNHNILANNTALAGHVLMGDCVGCGGYTLIHQYCQIGSHVFTGGGSVITRDVAPFVIVQGSPAAARGINSEGLRRRGFAADDVAKIKDAYKLVYLSGLKMDEVKQELAKMASDSAHVAYMLKFIEGSKRALQR
ncbi:acyl-ACP--UDP-N-acetylglucosamine O-acyltransferase [Solimonas terrae]|uniref:Acyl-[acyl-carrier-protein]--UDP-N-acetylglucosamine O-acyltransferase n=1 Tax=Solimonas terrae TaxID=1396819 RepID=A0A6M2BNE3_9GAMM|nr:acyl-ACP--UDP-N-acetylglucosamine O-acyltransferase [Solimonas terrae]NGY03553.1 acyl-ACP--UDP-N-acetylglucosamine O-acyltransferase [Solimonas terrae]